MVLFFLFADHMLSSEHEEDLNVFQKKTSGVIDYTNKIFFSFFDLFFSHLPIMYKKTPACTRQECTTQACQEFKPSFWILITVVFPSQEAGYNWVIVFAFAAYAVSWCWVKICA